jgi:Na+-transporting NADH:ubiquinone oxidoreductase subunit NqrF
MAKKNYKKRLYKRISIDPGAALRVYKIESEQTEFFMVTLNVKGWEIPLAEGYTPWGTVSLAKLSPYARNSERLLRALEVLEQVII